MATATRIVNGMIRTVTVGDVLPTSYSQSLEIVASAPAANQIIGPITAGTNITLPSSGTYTGEELFIFINGQKVDSAFDYNFVGTAPRTQVTFTFNLVIGDKIEFVRQVN